MAEMAPVEFLLLPKVDFEIQIWVVLVWQQRHFEALLELPRKIDWERREIKIYSLNFLKYLLRLMPRTAIVLLMCSICFRARESDVTVGAVPIDYLLSHGRNNLWYNYLTRCLIAIGSRGAWRWGGLVHSHVTIQRNFLIGTVRALSARILFACLHSLRGRFCAIDLRIWSALHCAVCIFSVRAVVSAVCLQSRERRETNAARRAHENIGSHQIKILSQQVIHVVHAFFCLWHGQVVLMFIQHNLWDIDTVK